MLPIPHIAWKLVGADSIYPLGSMQVCAAFDNDSQALAGSVFNVALRVSRILRSSP